MTDPWPIIVEYLLSHPGRDADYLKLTLAHYKVREHEWWVVLVRDGKRLCGEGTGRSLQTALVAAMERVLKEKP